MFPIVSFDSIEVEQANNLLVDWGHRMGPLLRGNTSGLLSGCGKEQIIASARKDGEMEFTGLDQYLHREASK